MYHGKEGLFERIGNRCGGVEDLLEAFIDPLRYLQRVIHHPVNPNGNGAQTTTGLRIGQQIA